MVQKVCFRKLLCDGILTCLELKCVELIWCFHQQNVRLNYVKFQLTRRNSFVELFILKIHSIQDLGKLRLKLQLNPYTPLTFEHPTACLVAPATIYQKPNTMKKQEHLCIIFN